MRADLQSNAHTDLQTEGAEAFAFDWPVCLADVVWPESSSIALSLLYAVLQARRSYYSGLVVWWEHPYKIPKSSENNKDEERQQGVTL